MDLNVLVVLFVGVFVQSSVAKEKVHLKIHVPEFINHHHHTKYLYVHDKKPPKKVHVHYHPAPKVEVHYASKIPSFHFYEDDTPPKTKSWKVMKSEKYETETIDNPNSDDPNNKYLVKSTYKIREKLPFDDTTIGYDQQYEYPLSETEHDFNKNKDSVDYQNSHNDPFPGGDHGPITEYRAPEYKAAVLKENKKGPKTNYHFQYPADDYDYHKTVSLIDSYISKTDPEHHLEHEFDLPKKKSKKTKEQNYNDIDIEYGPGPDSYTYENYKTDGPSFDYLNSDYSNVNERKVPSNN